MSRETFYQKYYKNQPDWAKGVINVVVVGGVAFAGYSIYRNAQKRKEIEAANQAAEYATDELGRLAARGIRPTYLNSEFELMAGALVQAMNGCGTDEEMILDVFRKMRNDADVLKLITVFGVRFYQPCAASQPLSYLRWMWDDQSFGGGIGEWLSYDLSSGYIEDINDILRSRGITYSF